MFLYRKILIVFSVILLSNFFVFRIYAQEYIKSSYNPIIKNDSSIKWKSLHVANPFVIYDNGIFKMWYSVHDGVSWKIAYATSNDGIIWQDYQINPVIIPANDGKENHTHTPKVVKNTNNHYFLYYTASPDDATYFEIRAAESINGINWTKIDNFSLKISQSWEHGGLANPMVIKDNSIYHMWYDSHDGSNWRVGYATSTDGISWNKYPYNPLSLIEGNASGALFVLKDGVKFKGWRHGGLGIPNIIYEAESTDYINWVNKKMVISASNRTGDFDKIMITAPSAVILGNKTYLYYTGFNGTNWQIGLAIKEMPTPTPTPIAEKIPTVLIPGFMASWNKEAILHNSPSTTDKWQMAPFVKDYDGIINTFKNLGYQENQDLFVYPYDWRGNLDNSADNLNNFLQQKIWQNKPDTKINIIGHSLGGLIGRIWSQKYNQNKVNKLITIGTPHKGMAQVYKAVEAGEIDKSNDWLWLTEKMVLMLNKDSIETDKETINTRFPVLKDIFPTYDFLKKNNNFIPINSMHIKNNFLITSNDNQQSIFPYLQTIVGEKANTLSGFTVGNQSTLDYLLNLYIDGRPINTFNNLGDYLVLSSSAGIGNNIKSIPLDHGQLIYTKEGQKKILEALSLPYQEEQISNGQGTNITPSLIFLIKSPAQMEVTLNNKIYLETDGIIFIPNPSNGDYLLKVKGKENGVYNVIIGETTSNGDSWNTITGEINAINPEQQIDVYNITYNSEKVANFFVDSNDPAKLLNDLIIELSIINQPINDNLAQAIKKLRNYKNNNDLLTVHKHLFNAMKEINATKRNLLLNFINKYEYLYNLAGANDSTKAKVSKLQKDIEQYAKKIDKLQSTLKNKQSAILFNLLMEKFNKAKESFYDQNYRYTEILLQSVKEIMNLIKE